MSMENDSLVQQDILLRFRAGRMFLEGTRVVPDTRKGFVQITRDFEGLIHIQWLERTQVTVEDDQIIFPDEACFEKVNQSPDRVYILKFNTDSRKIFFWMQEPDASGDAEICTTVNVLINQPSDLVGDDEPETSVPLPGSERSDDTAEGEMSSRAGNLHDQNVGSELVSEATSAGPTPVVQLEDLQRILRSIQPQGILEDPDGGFGLADILKPDLVLPLIDTLPLEHRLASFLPEGSQTRDDLIELLQSPPFRQQVDTFTHVLRTGQIDLSQFGIDPSKYKFTVLSFLEALDDSVAKADEAGESELAGSSSQRCQGNDPMDES